MIARLLFGLACLLMLAGCSLSTTSRMRDIDLDKPAVLPEIPANGEAYPLQPPNAERGAALYAEKCVACHGVGGAGDGVRAAQIKSQGKLVANLALAARQRAVKPVDWHTLITVGRIQNLMPGFSGSLNAQDRWDVLAYVWSLGANTADLTAGRATYAERCASCHGASGEGKPNTPGFTDGRWLAETSLLELNSRMLNGDAHKNVKLRDDEPARQQVALAVRAFAYVHADPAALRAARIDGAGVLELQAINASPNAPPIGALPVTLRALDENGEVFSRTATLDASGKTTFAQLPQRADYFYQAELDYSGGLFFGAPVQVLTDTKVTTGLLPIYETTADASAITINTLLYAVQDVREGELTVVEVYEFDNPAERAYVGENRRSLKISVPDGATNIRFDGLGFGKRFVQEGDVIFDTDVTTPGAPAQRITLIYDLPYRDQRAIRRKVFYPVGRWTVFLPDPDGFAGTPVRATGALKDDGRRAVDGVNIRIYSGSGTVPANGELAFEVSGQPLGAERPGNDGRAIGLALMALAVTLGATLLLFLRVRALRNLPATPAQLRQQFLSQIVALDEEHAAGKFTDQEHARERERLLAVLRDIWSARRG